MLILIHKQNINNKVNKLSIPNVTLTIDKEELDTLRAMTMFLLTEDKKKIGKSFVEKLHNLESKLEQINESLIKKESVAFWKIL